MKGKKEIEQIPSAEEKIKEAARDVFTRKGYAATRTRDIAEESGYNLALINYYFRSKEKLFDIIMVEHLQTFIHSVLGIVNDPQTTLLEKVEILAGHYIDMLIANPNLPLFILNEINADPKKLTDKLGFAGRHPQDTVLSRQWVEYAAENKITVHPLHLLMNFVGLTIFPFVGAPMIKNRTGISNEEFNRLMKERKKLIPMWVAAILQTKPE
jgi:AcrR family transcriptional regulator